MTCRGVMLFEDSQEAGRTLREYTSLWPIAGLCTTILAVGRSSWRRVHEGEGASQGQSIPELCCGRRTRLASCGKGCAQDSTLGVAGERACLLAGRTQTA